MPLIPLQSPTRSLRRFAAWVLVITTTFTVVLGLQSWQAVRADQVNQLTTAVQIGARAVDRYLGGIDAGLRSLAPTLVGADGELAPPAVSAVLLRQFHDLQPDLAAVTLFTPDGHAIASSSRPGPIPAGTIEAGPSFAQSIARSASGHPVAIGRAVLGPTTHRWVFAVIHVIRDRNDAPVAVVIAGVPVELMQTFWRDAPLMQRAVAGLIRDDGYLVSRYPIDATTPPEKLFGAPRQGALQEYLEANHWPAEGTIEGRRGADQTESGFVFRRLEHYPLTLFVALPLREYVAAWWQRARAPALLLFVLALAGAAAYRLALQQQARWADERRRAEAALLASQAEQHFVLDRMAAGMVLHDGTTGAMLWCNAPASQMLGLDAGTPNGSTHRDPRWHFLREDGSPLSPEDMPVGRVIATGRAVSDLVVGVEPQAGGEPTWLLAHAYPDRDADGRLHRILVSFVDITERRRAERALVQRERTYRLLFDNSSDGVLNTRPDGRILAANPAACSIFGMSEQALRTVGRGVLVDPDDPVLVGTLATLAREGRDHTMLQMRRGDGTPFEADVSSTLYTDAGGEPCCCVVVRDVTDQRRAESALRAKALAEEANRAKSAFVARMSHELRTPLNAILGFSELLQDDAANPPSALQRERLDHVRRAGAHLLRLINDLLDLSRIEAGALSVREDDVDFAAAVRDATRELAPLADAAGVRLLVALPADDDASHEVHVRGDALRLRQVVLNLVSNAIKYNRPGGAVRVALSAEGEHVRLAVHDTGLGMSADQLTGLYQPFNRLGREASGIEGTAIGLVVTRSLVEMMRGTLRASSRAGDGSEFVVEFPSAAHPGPAGEPHGAAAAASAPLEGPPGPEPSGDRPAARVSGAVCHVLYVDDDDVNRELMRAFFQLRPDLSLVVADDGAQALRFASALHPQLALIDLMMPGLDGFDVLRALRADPHFAGLRCVAVSANAMPDEIDEALAAGFDAYLTKPLSSDTLMRTLDRFLARP